MGAPLNKPEPTPRRRFLKQLCWLALLHFVVLKVVEGIIFFAAHTPPKAVNLDAVIYFLVHIEDVLVFPRWVVLRCWPWENTPRGLGLALTIFNSVVWGAVLAVARTFWHHATR